MPTYILLLTLTQNGRAKMVDDMQSILRAESQIAMPGIEVHGLYGVLGDYDFVSIVEATDNEQVARFSLQLGLMAGAHIATLPAIPISRLEGRRREERLTAAGGLDEPRPEGPRPEGPRPPGPAAPGGRPR